VVVVVVFVGGGDDDGDDSRGGDGGGASLTLPFTKYTPLHIFLSLLRRYIQDHGSVFDTGSATHRLTMYRASSGSLVFGAGTVQWVWALDPEHDPNDPPRANT
jgi:hypothetical protein